MVPMQHQADVVKAVQDRRLRRVLLNWGLGSGKTYAGLLIAQNWKDEVKIVVCPKSLVSMWLSILRSETRDNVTDLTSDKCKTVAREGASGWYVINYDLLQHRPWITDFAQGTTLILDESSYVKHLFAKRTQIAMDMSKKVSHIAMLSGTPCGGKWEDMWTHAYLLGRYMKVKDYEEAFLNMYTIPVPVVRKTQMTVRDINVGKLYKGIDGEKVVKVTGVSPVPSDPDRKDEKKSIRVTYELADGTAGQKTVSESDMENVRQIREVPLLNKKNPYKMDCIRDILIPDLEEKGMFVLRTEDCLSLPEVSDMTINVGMPREYIEFIRNKETEIKGDHLEGDNIMALRQGMRRLSSSYNDEKIEAVEDLLNSTDDRVVVFYQFKNDFEVLNALCRKLGKPVVAVNGDRNDIRKAGNAYETKENSVCLIQWQSGGYGLNLQKAHVGVFFSLTESYELYEQARGRIHRKGQENPVIYYNICAKGTIDEKIARALAAREDYDDKKFVKDFPEFAGMPSGEPENTRETNTAAKSLDKALQQQPSLFDLF